jgi:hypothetical protein
MFAAIDCASSSLSNFAAVRRPTTKPMWPPSIEVADPRSGQPKAVVFGSRLVRLFDHNQVNDLVGEH